MGSLTVSSVIFLRLRRHEKGSCTKWREPACQETTAAAAADELAASPGTSPRHTSSSGGEGMRTSGSAAPAVAAAMAGAADSAGGAGVRVLLPPELLLQIHGSEHDAGRPPQRTTSWTRRQHRMRVAARSELAILAEPALRQKRDRKSRRFCFNRVRGAL